MEKERSEQEVNDVIKAKQDDAYAFIMSVVKSEACDR